MAKQNIWNTNVNEIMHIFHDAVISLIPFMDKARIPWQHMQSYDDWDNIVQTMFDAIVTNSIRWSFPESDRDKFNFVKYDHQYSDYQDLVFIEVIFPNQIKDSILVFQSFITINNPLDGISYVVLDRQSFSVIEATKKLSLEKASFQLRLNQRNGSKMVMENINVLL